MELNKKQRDIVETKHNKVIVLASAASGKTATLTERVRYLVHQGVHRDKIVVITFTRAAANEMSERLGEDGEGIFIGTVHSYATFLLFSAGITETADALENEDFDKLFELISEHREVIKPIDYLLLDEAQDSDEQQFDFILNYIQPKSFMFLGDLKQCQPSGTKITLFDKTVKNIEDIQIGDKIIAYDLHEGGVKGGTAPNAKPVFITDKAERILDDEEELITLTFEDGSTTIYTYNHIAVANLCRYDEYNYLTYLMCDENNRFRVGTSQFKNTNTTPWRRKMIDEKCTKIWILDTFKTNKEARILEDKVSYYYQIPQVTFQLNKTSYEQKDIDYIYEGLNTYESAKKCLKDFHRDIRYPFSQVGDNIHYAGNAFNKTYACNILPHNMVMLQFNPDIKHRKQRINITSMEYSKRPGQKVYSLEVENYHTYIGDNIITHNCIYSFAGSRPDILEELLEDDEVITLPLNENYRNTREVFEFAKWIIKPLYYDNSIIMSTDMGRVDTTEYTPELITRIGKSIGEDNYGNWFFLGRTNAQVDSMKALLERAGVPCDTFKRADFTSISELNKRLRANTVKVLTIHTSKGLEAENVVVQGARFFSDEERRIAYVAATRAKKRLIWLNAPKKKYKSKTTSWI